MLFPYTTLFRSFFDAIGSGAVDHHVGAGLGQADGHSSAQAGARTSNQGVLALEAERIEDHVFLLSAGFQTRTAGVEARLHVHHAELPVFLFLMRRHGPQEADAVARNGNVDRKSTRLNSSHLGISYAV